MLLRISGDIMAAVEVGGGGRGGLGGGGFAGLQFS
jgi:hypothetical protein